MCIVIDTNTVVATFDPQNRDHAIFRPVLDWIISGRGKIVLGGSKYREEVFVKIRKYNRLFHILRDKRKVVEIHHETVDIEEVRIKSLESSTDFDDAHLIALLDVSGCALICSKDERAYRFIKKKELYKHRNEVPKIYRSQQNTDLLCDMNIAPCCEPKVFLNKTERDAVAAFVTS